MKRGVNELLLRTAFAPADETRAAWREARSRLNVDRLGPGSLALLPLVYRALERSSVDDPLLPRLKGIYRRTWVQNNILLDRAAAQLDRLAQAGIDALLVGGVGTALRFYGDLGLRPARRIELLVAPDAVDEAARLTAGQEQTVLATTIVPGPYAAVRAEAEPFELRGVGVLVPSPSDELFHAVVTAAGRPSVWIADAALILRADGDGLRGERVIELARANRETLSVRATLDVLARLPGAGLPADVVRELEGAPVAPRERLAHALRSSRVSRALGEHLHGTLDQPVTAALRSFPRFLRQRWELERNRQIPFAASRRALRGLRGRR